MIRSMIIGRDRAVEVARRKETLEKELIAKREAQIQQQEERTARAQHQRELELKQKIRQRQQLEIQRQKIVLDRRCAELEKLNTKKMEILQKAHQTSSRTAQVKTKKQEYAFGSSSPRELNLNEGTRAKQSSPRVESSRQQLSPSNIPLDKNKIRTRRVQPLVGGATSSSMTQSVMGTLPPAARISSSHVTSRMVQNMPKDRKDFKASNITKKLVASTNKTASNMAMVKSLYVPPSEKFKTKSAASKRTSIMLNQVHKPTLNTLNGSGSQIENPPRILELNRIEDMPGSNFIPPCESKDNAEQNNNDGEIISSQTHDATQDSTIEMIQKQAQQKHDSMNTNNEDTSAYQSSSDVESDSIEYVGNVTQAIAEANSPNPNDIAFIERNDTVENFLSWLDVMKLFKAHSVLEPIDISSRSVNYADAEQAIQKCEMDSEIPTGIILSNESAHENGSEKSNLSNGFKQSKCVLDKNLTSKLIDETEQERILRRARISEILGSVRDGKKSTNGVDTSTNNSISSPKVNSEGIIEVDHGHEELPNIQTQY